MVVAADRGKADGDPAHDQALFLGEPVADDVSVGNVGKAHAAHHGHGHADEVHHVVGGVAPGEAGDGGDGQRAGPGKTGGLLGADIAPEHAARHGDPAAHGGEHGQHPVVHAGGAGEHLAGNVQGIVDQRAVDEDAREGKEHQQPALGAKVGSDLGGFILCVQTRFLLLFVDLRAAPSHTARKRLYFIAGGGGRKIPIPYGSHAQNA